MRQNLRSSRCTVPPPCCAGSGRRPPVWSPGRRIEHAPRVRAAAGLSGHASEGFRGPRGSARGSSPHRLRTAISSAAIKLSRLSPRLWPRLWPLTACRHVADARCDGGQQSCPPTSTVAGSFQACSSPDAEVAADGPGRTGRGRGRRAPRSSKCGQRGGRWKPLDGRADQLRGVREIFLGIARDLVPSKRLLHSNARGADGCL
jgi:hypothetical protein